MINGTALTHADQEEPRRSISGIWDIETADVKGEFERMEAAGAMVVVEPYEIESAPGSAIATLADPDETYLQLKSPMDFQDSGDTT